MRYTYLSKTFSVEPLRVQKRLDTQLVLCSTRLNRYRRQIFSREHTRRNTIIIKTYCMRQSIFQQLVINRKEPNWGAAYVYAFRHPLIW